MLFRWFIIFIFSSFGLSARAADMQWISVEDDWGDAIFLEGTITGGDLQKLSRTIDLNHWKENLLIMFNSSGGDIFESVKMGRYIRHKRFVTVVNGDNICYSACFFSFIGGIARIVDPTAKIGVHQFYGATGDAHSIQSRTQHLTSEVMDYTESMGVSIETIKIAARTLPQDMYVFSQSEIKNFNLMTGEKSQEDLPPQKTPPISATGLNDSLFWQQDGWKVEMSEEKQYCSMHKRSSYKAGGMLWLMTAKDLKLMNMSYVNKPDFLSKFVKENRKNVRITLFFGNKKLENLSAVYDKGQHISSFDMPLQKKDITSLYNSNILSLSIEGKHIDTFSLKGSAKAFQALNRCYDALP